MTRAIFACVLAGALFLCLTPLGASAAQTLDKIVAVAGQSVILDSEVDQAVQRLRRRMGARISRVPENVLRSQILDRLILRSLQLQRAKRRGLSVPSQALTQAMKRLATQNGVSLRQFKAALRAQGIRPSQVRQRMYESLLINKLRQQEVINRVQVSEEAVTRYLQNQQLRVQENREYHIRHILIAVSEDAKPKRIQAARQHAEELRQLATSGQQSFANLALAHSDGQRAMKGGDLGWLPGGYLPTLFADIVPKLSTGEVSKVFRGPGGFHLIKLVGIRSKNSNQTTGKSKVIQEAKVRQIVVKLTEIRDNKRARQKITRLRKRLLAGGDFAQLARTESDDTRTASQGGDMGWIRPRRVPPAFAKHLQGLEIGEVSEPFRTDQGWRIIQVQDRRKRDVTEQRRRRRARRAIGRRKVKARTTVWRQKIRDEAYVDIRMEGYVGQAD